MSASLVGSEMCIRDSLALAATRDFELAAPYLPLRQSHLEPRGVLAALRNCLLYTSDAADDM
eukprot:12321212-Alexandrium_andersonii.AAC.1